MPERESRPELMNSRMERMLPLFFSSTALFIRHRSLIMPGMPSLLLEIEESW